MRVLRVLVVDDETPARARLRRLLESVPTVDVVGEAEDGERAAELIMELAPDLVLLDITMPRLDGFGVISAMGREMPATIFCTAHDEHALRAFEVHALDYLLKPVQAARLAQSIERVRSLLGEPAMRRRRGIRAVSALLEERGEYLSRLLVHDERRAYLVVVDRIDHIRAERNYCWVKVDGKQFRVRRTLASLAQRLDPKSFLRINKSDIIRLDAVHEIQPWSHGDYRVVMRNGTTLSWSRRYRAAATEE